MPDLLPLIVMLDTDTEPLLELHLDEEEIAETEKERQLVCLYCKNVITFHDEAIRIQGQHEHTRLNPHGLVFSFGCFRSAPGCDHEAEESMEYTWFSGFAWSVAFCNHCKEHLGWRFKNEQRLFYGLILNKIVHFNP